MASDGSGEFKIVSPVFKNGEKLPRLYSEPQGKRIVSPQLEWYNLPEGTKSLVLVVEDLELQEPGKSTVPWANWIIANISPTVTDLADGYYSAINSTKVPGSNESWVPTPGHRIQFNLFALDIELNIDNKEENSTLLAFNTDGHVLGEANLMAIF